jgi:hypothetical protein
MALGCSIPLLRSIPVKTGRRRLASAPKALADSGMVADLAAVKSLGKRLGADQVKRIVALFE